MVLKVQELPGGGRAYIYHN